MLKFFRQTHLFIGIFISPALLFFALSGALQTFNLHEAPPGSQPPHWIALLAQVHKNQTDAIPHRKPAPDTLPAPKSSDKLTKTPTPPTAAPSDSKGSKPLTHIPLKIFFLLVALGLFTSTLTGIYMAYKYNRNKYVVSGLLLAGLLIPLILLKF